MRVLVAVDQSEYAAYALDYLRRLPCHDTVDLTLVTVMVPIPAYDLTGTGYVTEVPELMRLEMQGIQDSLQSTANRVRKDFNSVETQTIVSSPGSEIVRLAKETNAELVVLGAIGHSAIARVLLGSVSDYVATHAGCSTIVVRPARKKKPVRRSALSPPKNVLVAVGNSDSDEGLANWIARLKLPTETEIHFVHILESFKFFHQDLLHKASSYWNEARSPASKHIDRFQQELQTLGFKTQSELIEATHIGQALVKYADSHKCDLIITGDQRETVMERIFLGSASRHVLRHAQCSVMIVRDTQEQPDKKQHSTDESNRTPIVV